MGSHFNKKEIEFIQENYPKYGSDYCAKFINQPNWRIQKKANRIGLTVNKITRDKIKINNGKQGWDTRWSKIQTEIYDNFIRNFETPEMVYFLGFLWGDGHLEKNSHRISIKITKKDGIILKRIFCKFIPFKIASRKSNRYKDKNKDIFEFRFSNKFIYDFLAENDYIIKSGASPDKILSKIPEHLKHYWWRGYSDADGCFFHKKKTRSNNFSICSVYNQDWSFLIKLEKLINVKFSIYKRKTNQNQKHSVAHIQRIDFIQNYGNYIYQNYNFDKIGLNRKYKKFIKIQYNPKLNKQVIVFEVEPDNLEKQIQDHKERSKDANFREY